MGHFRKRRVVKLVQFVITVVAFAYLAKQVQWERTVSQIGDITSLSILAILGITMLEFFTRFSMWWVLIRARSPIKFRTAAQIDLVIKFINHLIPSKASGHSLAPLILRYYTKSDWSEAVSIVGVNTGLYATLYGTVSIAGIAIFAPRLPKGLLFVLILSTAIYTSTGVLILLVGRNLDLGNNIVKHLNRLFEYIPQWRINIAETIEKIPNFTTDSVSVFHDLSSRASVVLPYSFGWVGTLLVFPGLRVWILLSALGGTFHPAFLIPVVLVLAYSVTVLPITPGGVGIAEASAVIVFIHLGVGEELAVAVILIDRALGVYLPALLGWIPIADLDLIKLLNEDI